MFLTCILSVLLSVFFVFLNRQNKFSYLLAANFSIIAVTLAVGSIYMSKCSTYPNITTIDYSIYSYLHDIKLTMTQLSRIYNFCFAALMVISVSYLFFFTHLRYITLPLFLIPIAIMLIWCDRYVAESVFLYMNSHENLSQSYFTLCDTLNGFFSAIFTLYILLPVCLPLVKMIKSKIFACKNENLFLSCFMAAASFFVIYAFVFGPFSPIFFTATLGISKIPNIGHANTSYATLFAIYILAIGVTLLTYTLKNNLYRVNSIYMAKLFRRNISMQLHSYKNAFISVAMQLNLAKTHLTKGDQDECIEHIEQGIATVNKYSDIFMRNIRLLTDNYYASRGMPINLVLCIEAAINICDSGHTVNVTRNYNSDLVMIYAQRYHITEVFVNIVNNALTAVRKASRTPHIQINLLVEENWCMVEVVDNGIGIEKSNRRLIFEPFYSTNGYTNGSGIGLYYVKKIVKAYNGEIRFISRPNEYTKFQIAFPTTMKGE